MAAKKTTKKPKPNDSREKDLRTASTSDDGTDLMPKAHHANNEALGWLNRLDRLASCGDRDALRMFYSITCGMVSRLNEIYQERAASVLEWPILLPQDRKKRNAVTAAANEMRIGSVTAGKGRPSELAYHSEKGFSISNLKRVAFARAVLRPLAPAYADMDGNPITTPSRAEDVMRKPKDFKLVTGIEQFDREMLENIGNVPEYNPASKDEWVAVILRMLKMNPSLIPANIAKRNSTSSKAHKPGKGLVKVINERGGRLKKTLDDGLSRVSAIPGGWGD